MSPVGESSAAAEREQLELAELVLIVLAAGAVCSSVDSVGLVLAS